MGAIIGMAQTFVGSNNINLLYPSGQFGTRLMGGSDAADSDAALFNGNPSIMLTSPASGVDYSFDFGFTNLQSILIGDTIWFDSNLNGIFNLGESVFSGVILTLSDSSGAPIATTTTDSSGNYFFETSDGISPNTSYTLTLDASNFALDGVLAGLQPTIQKIRVKKIEVRTSK